MGQGRFVAKECSRLFDLYHSGEISRHEMDRRLESLKATQKERIRLIGLYHDEEISRAALGRQLKMLNTTQSALPFAGESSDTTESMGSTRPHNKGTQA